MGGVSDAPTTTRSKRPRQGEVLELDIDSLAQGGRGVARADGYVVFPNPNAVPGREWFYFARPGQRA